jgi:hypothetical protein
MTTAPPAKEDRPRFGRALALRATSIALVIGSFFFVPWGWQLGSLAANCRACVWRPGPPVSRGDTALALIGIGLAFVVVLFVVLLI